MIMPPRATRAEAVPTEMMSLFAVRLTDLSLSRERPPRARVPHARRLAKHEGLQPRASLRPLDGCSEKLAGTSFERLEAKQTPRDFFR